MDRVVRAARVFDRLLPTEGHTGTRSPWPGTPVGTPVELDKCVEIGWFTLDALRSPLSRITAGDVEKYRSGEVPWNGFRPWARGGMDGKLE